MLIVVHLVFFSIVSKKNPTIDWRIEYTFVEADRDVHVNEYQSGLQILVDSCIRKKSS